MRLIVGLGNPGKQYERTRHNVGFMVLDKIAENKGVNFSREESFKSRMAEIDVDGIVKLVEPQTFMNESGWAVAKVKNYWKISSEDVWLIYDDVDLEFGKIRIGLGGTSAGHKGVQSIINNLGDNFWRIRVGVGKSEKIETEKWVLQNFSPSERKKLILIVDKVADFLIESFGKDLKEETIKVDK